MYELWPVPSNTHKQHQQNETRDQTRTCKHSFWIRYMARTWSSHYRSEFEPNWLRDQRPNMIGHWTIPSVIDVKLSARWLTLCTRIPGQLNPSASVWATPASCVRIKSRGSNWNSNLSSTTALVGTDSQYAKARKALTRRNPRGRDANLSTYGHVREKAYPPPPPKRSQRRKHPTSLHRSKLRDGNVGKGRSETSRNSDVSSHWTRATRSRGKRRENVDQLALTGYLLPPREELQRQLATIILSSRPVDEQDDVHMAEKTSSNKTHVTCSTRVTGNSTMTDVHLLKRRGRC